MPSTVNEGFISFVVQNRCQQFSDIRQNIDGSAALAA
jgi:hypothetical protein